MPRNQFFVFVLIVHRQHSMCLFFSLYIHFTDTGGSGDVLMDTVSSCDLEIDEQSWDICVISSFMRLSHVHCLL